MSFRLFSSSKPDTDDVEPGWFITPDEPGPDPDASPARRGRRWLWGGGAILVVLLLLGIELKTSWGQAFVLSTWADAMTYTVEPGRDANKFFPEHGPYNARLGYARLPGMLDSLEAYGFRVTAQARTSGAFDRAVDWGLYPAYRHKDQAGLWVQGEGGSDVFRAAYPKRVYPTADSIPRLVWQTLLFIENKELMDDDYRYKNPAIEWDRFAAALVQRIATGGEGPGGSTLATQLTKVRHSPDGLTTSSTEKLRQMASASLMAYREGAATVQERREIVKEYLNALPLSASPGYGEVNGLGDGLWAWYGADVDRVNRLLARADTASADLSTADSSTAGGLDEAGAAYRQVLSLLLSTRSPSRFLLSTGGEQALNDLADRYLPLLARDGLISESLRDAALDARPSLRRRAPEVERPEFVARKAASAIRTDLLSLLNVTNLPALDRYDLRVSTPFDQSVQGEVVDVLRRLHDPAFVQQQGLVGQRLLASGDPSQVTYSFVLYERDSLANVLRVQADNFPGPFDVNRGSKLELGSTAKLRTLITYLELVERVYDAHRGRPVDSLRALPVAATDAITRWTVDQLIQRPDLTREQVMEAAMNRTYSGSAGERFFTGGGLHRFNNFSADTGGMMTVHTAMQYSVNLVFIRMMRDVVNYHVARLPGQPAQALADASDARRADYLRRFAAQEGATFVRRYYRTYRDEVARGQLLQGFGEQRRLTARRLAWAYRSIFPESTADAFASYLRRHATDADALTDARIADLFANSRADRFSWQDRGYLAGVHPLELWVLNHLFVYPGATMDDVLAASAEVRQEVYAWLFTKRKESQDPRIRTILEQEAFVDIHHMWSRLGYPFDRLVASYATAIGSSADRPSSLSELIGIVLRDGVRYPQVRLDTLHFAAGTPYETVATRAYAAPERVLSPELCRVVRLSLLDVVERGTAVRARGAMKTADGTALPIGGKTGTGDNRVQVVRADGARQGTAMSRTSTFVFFAGDRFFGTVVAYVPGRQAEDFDFTSSLVASVLNVIGPSLTPLTDAADARAAQRIQADYQSRRPAPRPALPRTEEQPPPDVNETQVAPLAPADTSSG